MPKNNIIAQCLLLPLLCLVGCSEQDELPPQAIAENNRGVALMGQFNYEQARATFQPLSEQYPQQPTLRTNLAIALLNRQQKGDNPLALQLLAQVLTAHPQHLAAQYCSGILQLHEGHPERARPYFQKVVAQDPNDAYAAYYLGQTLAQSGQFEQALHWYQQAIEQAPYLRSAYYAAFQTLQKIKKRQQARAMLENYQRLENNPQARLAEIKYTRMGPKCEAQAIGIATAGNPPLPKGALFAPPTALLTDPKQIKWQPQQANITAADLNGDGLLDLFLANALATADTPNAVLFGQAGTSTLRLDSTHPLAKITKVHSVLWGDIDNDGLLDAYLLRQGHNQLWMQTPQGWQDHSAASLTATNSQNTVDGALFDADHDGDLDLFLVNQDGPNRLLHNRLNGTFVELDLPSSRPAQQVAIADIDHDRDADIIVLHSTPPHQVFINDRLWNYHQDPRFKEFEATPLRAVVAADTDADGQVELYSLDHNGKLARWQPNSAGLWAATTLAENSQATALTLADVNGDTRVELLLHSPLATQVIQLAANPPLQTLFTTQTPLLHGTTVLFSPTKGPALLGFTAHGPQHYAPGPGRYAFMALSFSGREEKANATRSNASGIGTRHALRIGKHWSTGSGFRPHSGPGQSLQAQAAGLAGAAQADFIAIYWSDGVYQTELGLKTGLLHHISETQRQLSSCPVLFAWNGKEFAFISDLLGVGGLGYAIAPGVYAEPRPRESFLLQAPQLQAQQGRYLLKLGEPMEEAAYLDAARLSEYHLPPGWQMGLDERMGIQGTPPSGAPFFYRNHIAVTQAINERGQIVTETLLQADLQAAPLGPLDHRFIGRLAQEHLLTLDFAQAIAAQPGQPWLLAEGWIEYPYSQTSFAAWQANASFQPPTLEARDAEGKWHTVWKEFGYPAGMPRQMALPLVDLPSGSQQLRLRSNQEIYWDRIRIVYAEKAPKNSKVYSLPLQLAEVNQSGFPRRSNGPQRQPSYDYKQRAPFWDTRHMAGYYSAFGPVTELVAEADDGVAIIGPGEEIHLEFLAHAPEAPPGWRKFWVLESNGWAKDMDLYTQNGETIAPLPSTGKPRAKAEQLHRRFNTRYVSGG